MAALLGAAIGTAVGLVDDGLAVGLTVAVLCAHVALRPISVWFAGMVGRPLNG